MIETRAIGSNTAERQWAGRRSVACCLAAWAALWGSQSWAATEPADARTRVGFAADLPLTYSAELPEDVRRDLEEYYQVGAGRFRFDLTPASQPDRPGRIAFPSARPSGEPRNDTVHADWYPSRLPGRRPAVIVLHILDGRMVVARIISYYLSTHGVHACLMHLPHYGRRSGPRGRKPLLEGKLDKASAAIAQGVTDIRRCAGVLRALPEVESRRVGIIGVSLGAYAAGLASGVDRQFSQTVLVLAGAPIADVILQGAEESRDIREKMLVRGHDADAIRRLLRPVEPLRYAHRVPRGTVTLYAATRDEVIPKQCSLRLAEAMGLVGKRDIRWLHGSHSGVAWMLPLVLPQVARVLGAEFADKARPPGRPTTQPHSPVPQASSLPFVRRTVPQASSLPFVRRTVPQASSRPLVRRQDGGATGPPKHSRMQRS